MLRHVVRWVDWAPMAVGVRLKSTNVPKMPSVSWSTGEVTHPAPMDCPLGNKGEYPQKMADGGVQYFGFQYYPRFPDEVDPPYDPAPLHLVTRVRCLKGKPWWDKDIMKQLGLDGKRSDVAIVKNNPENNAMLWKVKYLIKVTPIRLPADLPDDADPKSCYLKETGEFIHSPRVKVDDSALEEDPKITQTKWTNLFIDKHTRRNWEYPWQLKLC